MSRSGLPDTSPEAQRVLAAAYRAMSPARKWELIEDLYRLGRDLHATGVRSRRPGATAADIRDDWIAQQFGKIPGLTRGTEATPLEQPIQIRRAVRAVANAFEFLGIPYALGGSLASSIHGYARLTSDADISAEPFSGQEARFAAQFGPDFYLSVDAIVQAIRDRSTFNIISTRDAFKIDVFIRKDRPFERLLMQRRAQIVSPVLPDRPFPVVTAEDVILLKLEWFRLGGEVSDRQWSDVLGVLRTRADGLDAAYLDRWAADLGVADLLAEARGEAGT